MSPLVVHENKARRQWECPGKLRSKQASDLGLISCLEWQQGHGLSCTILNRQGCGQHRCLTQYMKHVPRFLIGQQWQARLHAAHDLRMRPTGLHHLLTTYICRDLHWAFGIETLTMIRKMKNKIQRIGGISVDVEVRLGESNWHRRGWENNIWVGWFQLGWDVKRHNQGDKTLMVFLRSLCWYTVPEPAPTRILGEPASSERDMCFPVAFGEFAEKKSRWWIQAQGWCRW